MLDRARVSVVISGTGLYVPPQVISNDELVAAFNRYVELRNATHAKEIIARRRGRHSAPLARRC